MFFLFFPFLLTFTFLFFSLPREKRKGKKKGKKKQKIKFKSLISLVCSPLLLTRYPITIIRFSLACRISPFFSSINTNEYIPLPSRYLGTLLSNKQQIKNSSLHHNIHLFFLPSLLGVQSVPRHTHQIPHLPKNVLYLHVPKPHSPSLLFLLVSQFKFLSQIHWQRHRWYYHL